MSDHVSDRISDHRSPITPPFIPPLGHHLATPRPQRSLPGSPRGSILSIFYHPRSTSKKQRFFESPKNGPNGKINRPWRVQGSVWDQKTRLSRSFWHRFFDFFKKRRKCEISEEYNAKRGSEPSKTFHFRFGGSKRPSILKTAFLDRFSIFQGSQKRPLGRHFRPKSRFLL